MCRRWWLPEISAPKQGTAADLVKLAMVEVQNWLEQEKLQTRLIMQVHDELVLEVGLGVGANWEAAHKYLLSCT